MSIDISTEQQENIKIPKKRGPKPKKNKVDENYFGPNEELMVQKYISTNNNEEKNKIFKDYLEYPFTKMIESIIRRYHLFVPGEEFEDTFKSTMSYLITKINGFNYKKGKKAYSYCGTICRHYVSGERTKAIKEQNRTIPFDTSCGDSTLSDDEYLIDGQSSGDFNTGLLESLSTQIQYILINNSDGYYTDNDKKVGLAIVDLLQNWENIFSSCDEEIVYKDEYEYDESGNVSNIIHTPIITHDNFGNNIPMTRKKDDTDSWSENTNKLNTSSIYTFIENTTMLNSKEVRESIKKFKSIFGKLKEVYLTE